ncbi:hypothetical protein X732_30690 [Mesorhizobium sp. L2C066B000]|nr:hypothetical protein X732_30690 [Mesorhizobium sp. L2C066B000]
MFFVQSPTLDGKVLMRLEMAEQIGVLTEKIETLDTRIVAALRPSAPPSKIPKRSEPGGIWPPG